MVAEVAEQREEVLVPVQSPSKRAVLPCVMTSDALQGEVDAVADPGVHPAGAIDRWPAITHVTGEQDVAANGRALVMNLSNALPRNLIHHRVDAVPVGAPVRVHDRIAAQEELAHSRRMVKIGVRSRGVESELGSVRKRLAPRQLVVAAERRAASVGIPTARVELNLERDVDQVLGAGTGHATQDTSLAHDLLAFDWPNDYSHTRASTTATQTPQQTTVHRPAPQRHRTCHSTAPSTIPTFTQHARQGS